MTHWSARAKAAAQSAVHSLESAAIAIEPRIAAAHRRAAIASLEEALDHLEAERICERRERAHSVEQEARLLRELKASVK